MSTFAALVSLVVSPLRISSAGFVMFFFLYVQLKSSGFSKASINPGGKQDASRDTGDCCSLLGATEMRLANFRVVGLSPVSDDEPDSPGSSFARSCLLRVHRFRRPW